MEDDARYALARILFIILFASLLFYLGGYFYLKEKPLFGEDDKEAPFIKKVDTNRISISAQEFRKINYTSLKDNMTLEGFSWYNFSDNGENGYVAVKDDVDDGILRIEISYDSGNDRAYISGHYFFYCSSSRDILPSAERMIMENMEEVAKICGIALDTSTVEWSIDYTIWPTDC